MPGGRFVAEFGGKGNVRRVIDAINRAYAKFGIECGLADNAWYYPSVAEYAALSEKKGSKFARRSFSIAPRG